MCPVSPADRRGDLDISTVSETSSSEVEANNRIPGLTLLYHPDLSRVGERVELPELTSGREVCLSRWTPSFGLPRQGKARPLGEVHLSRRPLRLCPLGAGRLRLERDRVQTRVTVDGAVLDRRHELAEEDLGRGVVLLLANRVVLLLHLVDPFPPSGGAEFGLVGEGSAMAQLCREIRRAGKGTRPVLVRGETGTGKELVARAVHLASERRRGPYHCVNMAAIPPGLAAAELFGAAKGAFTGAEKRRGYFRQAQGGTLFLDEIGETPPEVQPLLLRVLESGRIQPVGGGRERAVDARIVAATDADLEAAVATGDFREPLLYRLQGCEIRLPPLRDRREDLGLLLLHFLRLEIAEGAMPDRLAAAAGGRPWLPAPLVARLATAPWPGNVRQLRNAARHLAAAYGEAERVPADAEIEGLAPPAAAGSPAVGDAGPAAAAGGLSGKKTKRFYRQPSQISPDELVEALRAHGWRLKPAARALGISRTALYGLIDRSPELRRSTELQKDEIEAGLERCGGDIDRLAEELRVSSYGLLHRMRELDIQ